MYILGISCFYHDSAACLVHDGIVVGAAQEERFSRKKHDAEYPELAIAFCLKQAGILESDLSAVVFYEKPFLKFDRILHSHFRAWPKSLPGFLKMQKNWMGGKLKTRSLIQKKL